jgi:membrane protein required for colicin V production
LNWLDITIIICIAAGVVKGLFDGLIKQLVSLAGLVLAILFAGGGAGLLQPAVERLKFIPPQLLYPICYVISFVVIIVLMALIGRLLEKIWKTTPFGCLNYLAGGVTGFVGAVILLSLILNVLAAFNKQLPIIKEETKKESVLFETVKTVIPTIYPYFNSLHSYERYPQSIHKQRIQIRLCDRHRNRCHPQRINGSRCPFDFLPEKRTGLAA